MKQCKHYVYRHVRHDTKEVFYVGIGTKNKRESMHRYTRAYQTSKSRSSWWQNVTNLTTYDVDIMYESDDVNIIKEKEKEFIKLYGRKADGTGTLVNLTAGGDGIESFSHTEESKILIGLSSKLRVHRKGYKLKYSEEGYINLVNTRKGKKDSIETRLKKSKAMLGNRRGVGVVHSKESMRKSIEKSSKPVDCFDLSGKFIKHYSSIATASKETDAKKIGEVCKGNRNHSGGFIWRWSKT